MSKPKRPEKQQIDLIEGVLTNARVADIRRDAGILLSIGTTREPDDLIASIVVDSEGEVEVAVGLRADYRYDLIPDRDLRRAAFESLGKKFANDRIQVLIIRLDAQFFSSIVVTLAPRDKKPS